MFGNANWGAITKIKNTNGALTSADVMSNAAVFAGENDIVFSGVLVFDASKCNDKYGSSIEIQPASTSALYCITY
jgi:hypothetical protein